MVEQRRERGGWRVAWVVALALVSVAAAGCGDGGGACSSLDGACEGGSDGGSDDTSGVDEVRDGDMTDGDARDGQDTADLVPPRGLDYEAGGFTAAGGALRSHEAHEANGEGYVAYTATAPALMSVGLMAGGGFVALAGSPYAAGALGGEADLAAQCGDGVVGVGEACDPPDQAVACADLDLGAGEALCLAGCQLDTSGCEESQRRFTKVAVAQGHACALDSFGQITCWGSNLSGQSAPRDGVYRDVFVGDALGGDGVIGEGFSCGLIEEGAGAGAPGQLACWGDAAAAAALEVLGRVDRLTIGDGSACHIDVNGALRCVGLGAALQTMPTPQVAGGEVFSGLSLGGAAGDDQRLCALDLSQAVPGEGWAAMCWLGVNGPQMEGWVSAGFTQLDVGRGYLCGVNEAGAVRCLEDPMVSLATPAGQAPAALEFAHVEAGAGVACGVEVSGQRRALTCWTRADATGPSQIADWGAAIADAQLQVEALSMATGAINTNTSSLALSDDVACVILEGGTQVRCSTNDPATLSSGVEAPLLESYRDVALVTGYSALAGCAVEAASGALTCWGGEDALGSIIARPAGASFAQVALDYSVGCGVLDSAGGVTCWGTSPDGLSPYDQELLGAAASAPAQEVAISGTHGCALGVDDVLRCWPHSAQATIEGVPQTELPDVIDFAVGPDVTCAVRLDPVEGTALDCYGSTFTMPTDLMGRVGVQSVSISSQVVCVIEVDDTLLCEAPQDASLALDAINDDPTPVAEVWTGDGAVCTRELADGALRCWALSPSPAIEATPEGLTFEKVTIGAESVCGLTEGDGSVVCWGAQARNLPPQTQAP